jgi:hypothetical protein
MEGLADLIVNECSGACFNTAKFLEEELHFLDIFESSIGAVVSVTLTFKTPRKLLTVKQQGQLRSSLLRSLHI